LIGVAVLILGSIALATWATKPAYTPLFSGLSAEDASAIVDQLRTSGVPYELSNGGATVLVPEASVYEERLTAASAGLPSASTGGYSLLDEMGVTASEFQQSVTYKRALEGELAKTVAAIKGITVASVQLAIPEDSVFVSERLDPTASVFVQTDTGVTLDSDQINAIVHLTSASIEGMSATNVAVIDASGAVLSAVGTGATGSADSQASDYEQRVRATVQAMLDRIVGAGNATVAVAATISNETAEVLSETFGVTPDVPALSESSDTESYTGTGDEAEGVLGADTVAAADAAGGTGTYTSESASRDNAVNKVTENRTVPAGAIARQTISVAINSQVADGIDRATIEGLVVNAAGIQIDRGDAVAVSMVDFTTGAGDDAAAALAAAENAANADRWASLFRTGIIALAIVIPLLFALILFLRRSKQEREVVDVGDLDLTQLLPASGAPGLASVTPGFGSATGFAPSEPAAVSARTEVTAADRRNAEIASFAAQDPKKAADYLRRLMDERSAP
jgi:flagellar M-ring protein FliF